MYETQTHATHVKYSNIFEMKRQTNIYVTLRFVNNCENGREHVLNIFKHENNRFTHNSTSNIFFAVLFYADDDRSHVVVMQFNAWNE